MKLLLLGILFIAGFLLNTQSQQVNQDSLLFIKTKAEFEKFEQEHGHFIQTTNVRLHYLSWGKPTGIPIVWVHGTYSNGYEFYGFADSLVKRGYYVIAIDNYGHGLTPIPDKEVSLYHLADDIKFLLGILKIEKVIIGGWSRGGSVATAFYDAYPDLVSAIILEDGGSVAWPTIDHRKSIDSLSAKIRKDFREYEKYPNKEFESEFEAVKQLADLKNKGRVFYSLSAVKKNSSGKWVSNPGLAELCGENSAEEFLNMFYRPFASPRLFGTTTVLLYPRIVYRNLDVPLLILDPISKDDQFKFEEENSKLEKAHPGLIKHKIYHDTSHGLKFQRPNDFLKDIISFLSTVKAFRTKK